jgi:hypothetical protein
VTLHSLRVRTVLVAPIRIGLGVLWLLVARLAGSAGGPALIAFLVGVFATAFLALADPRGRLLPGQEEPGPVPAGAKLASRWRQALGACWPSTFGVSLLAAVAAVPSPTMTALLGGVSAGLGVAAVLSLPRVDPALFVDPRTRVVYRGQ